MYACIRNGNGTAGMNGAVKKTVMLPFHSAPFRCRCTVHASGSVSVPHAYQYETIDSSQQVDELAFLFFVHRKTTPNY